MGLQIPAIKKKFTEAPNDSLMHIPYLSFLAESPPIWAL